jgi:hypothetical protein
MTPERQFRRFAAYALVVAVLALMLYFVLAFGSLP